MKTTPELPTGVIGGDDGAILYRKFQLAKSYASTACSSMQSF
jgi:hypothetical protein